MDDEMMSTATRAVSGDGTSFDAFRSTPHMPKDAPQAWHGRQVVGVEGRWYDVTSFLPHHPGGDILKEFLFRDATSVFYQWHPHVDEVLGRRKVVGTYDVGKLDPCAEDGAEKEYRQLQRRFVREGWYETDMGWFAGKVAFAVVLLLVTALGVYWFRDHWFVYVFAVTLAGFWQQCGFLMHDLMHSQITQRRATDHWLGSLFGSVLMGVCASWWCDEHTEHHTFTNTYQQGVANTDPQASEAILSQSPILHQFARTRLQRWLISVQHLTFLPMLFSVGRLGLHIDSWRANTRLFEWRNLVLHYAWLCVMLSPLATWRLRLQFYYLTCCLFGILELQLLISHYAKPFGEKQKSKSTSIFRRQIEVNVDIANSPHTDWFHGGLNLHNVHHLFPRLPRHRYREANELVQDVCKRYAIKIDEQGFFQAVANTLRHLKRSTKSIAWM